jgi:hypothetical protein
LSDRPADRRASFAEWLARQECTDCWRASNEGDEQDKAAWLKAMRAKEQTASEAWSEQYRMPSLEGTERAVTEGTTSGAEWAETEESARTVTRAFSVEFSLSK